MQYAPSCLALALTLSLASSPGVHAAPLPIEDFVRHPAYSTVRISPNGEYLAMTVERGEQDVLAVLRTRDLQLLKVNVLPNEKSVGPYPSDHAHLEPQP